MGAAHRLVAFVAALLLGLGLGLGLGLASCSLVLHFDPEQLLENNAERCSDGVDNDDNGLTDCAEPDCAIFDFCAETSEEACRDRVDNDRNGLIDCQDPGCLAYARCTEQPHGQCTDQLDNNADGLVDCQDFTCAAEPQCCTLVALLLEAPLVQAAGGCTPDPCQPGQTGAICAAFDPAHWVSIGAPAPAVAAGGAGLDPNRCDDCYDQGDCAPCADAVLLSTRTFTYRPGLQVGAQLHQAAGQHVRAGVALTWQTSFDVSGSCAGDAPLDRVAAVELTRDASGGSVITIVVDGFAESERTWPTDSVAAFVRMDPEGFARFYLRPTLAEIPTVDASPEHRSDRPLPASTAPVRLALYGGGAGLRVSAAAAWDTARCYDPVPSRVDPFPGGVALSKGAVDTWDSDMVESPTVVTFAGEEHLFYIGRDNAQGGLGAIGHAVLVGNGTAAAWVRVSPEAPLLRAEDLYAWPEGTAELYGPSALVLPDGRLALYFTVAWRDGEAIVWTGIDGAVSDDGVHFERLWSGGESSILLPPVTEEQNSDSWERAVRDPAVVWREVEGAPRFTMLYTGRSDPENPFTAQIGLATSDDGVQWRRDNLSSADCAPSLCNQPVVTPPADALVHTAVSDPTLVWDRVLAVFRLWYVWRVGQQFSLFHAVATADARSWVRFPGNPVLRSGDLPWCDDLYLDGPSAALDEAGRLRLWYHGHSLTYGHSICYAENTIDD
jgi:hypothetical protein